MKRPKFHKFLKTHDELLTILSALSAGGRVRGDRAAGEAAKLSGGAVGQLWSLCVIGAAEESCPAYRGLPVCAGSER